jgi:hypothetical protein
MADDPEMHLFVHQHRLLRLDRLTLRDTIQFVQVCVYGLRLALVCGVELAPLLFVEQVLVCALLVVFVFRLDPVEPTWNLFEKKINSLHRKEI